MDFYHQTNRLRWAVFFIASTFSVLTADSLAANNPLSSINAAGYSGQSGGIKTERSDDSKQNLAAIHNGDYAVYKNFDFDSGVAGFSVRIATVHDGVIEIRLDNPHGALLGSCPFKNTGGWQSWNTVSCKVDNSQAGVRDIYLVFHGKSKKPGQCAVFQVSENTR